MKNTLFYGDNLDILREHIPDDSIDLIYLDPPFNSKATYNILYSEKNGTASAAQIKAFEDTWHWDRKAEETYREIVEISPKRVADLIITLKSFLGSNDMMAYLVMMAIRLVELRRVLKNTGAIYLHCDPTASHFLKLVMDAVFGAQNFRNEIIWHYRKWPSGFKQFQRNHDIVFYYSKTDDKNRIFNIGYMERAKSTLKRFGTAKIISGYDDTGKRIPSQTEKEESKGVPRDDVWDIGRVPPIKQLFPTQKPEPLLERIIKASSKKADIVLDPFCGCGTTIVVAEGLKRKWIGIDITHLAISLMRHRLEDTFGGEVEYQVIGEPVDLRGAEALKEEDPYQFQWWALGLVGARPAESERKKGADRGIDGCIYFFDDPKKTETKTVILQVKGGHVNPAQIRDLKGVVEREKAQIGVFITLNNPTRPMRTEAVSAGYYRSPLGRDYPKVQILTVKELLEGKRIDCPSKAVSVDATFKKARRSYKGEQLKLKGT